jgi:hypothetical protein
MPVGQKNKVYDKLINIILFNMWFTKSLSHFI